MKKSFSILLGLIGVLVGLIIVLPLVITWNQYKSLVEEKASAALGRPVTIQGDIRFGILPTPYAKVTEAVIANPPGAASKNFATVKSLDIGVALAPLLTKKIQVTHITIKEPAITLETMANGGNNWSFQSQGNSKVSGTNAENTTTSTSNTSLSVDDLTIEKAYLRVINVPNKSQQVIGPVDGKFNMASLQGPISGKGTIVINEKIPVDFDLAIDAIPQESNGAIPFTVNLNILGKAAIANLKGQIQKGDTTALHGDLALTVSELPEILAALNKDGKSPDLPAALQKDMHLNGVMEYKNSRATLTNFTFASGGTEASGNLGFETSGQTNMTLDLTRIALPPEATENENKTAPEKTEEKSGLAQSMENGFQQAVTLLDTVLPTTPVNFVFTATQLPLPHQPVMRDVRAAASLSNKGATIQNIEAKLPSNTFIKLSGQLPARSDGRIDTAQIDASINSQDMNAALGHEGGTPTPLNAHANIILSREALRLHPLQIIQNGQTVQGDIVYNPKADNALIVALEGGALNLDAFLGQKAKQTGQKSAMKSSANKQGNKDPLTALQGLNAKITADLGSVTYQGKTANKVTMNALLGENGLQLQQANIGDLGGMTVQAQGSVRKFSPLSGVDINAKAVTPNLSQTLRALGNEAAQNLGASNFDISAKGDTNKLQLDINGKIDQGQLAINGTAKDLNDIPTFAGTVNISHPETATILRNFAKKSPAANLGPFALRSDIAYGNGTVKADRLTVKLGSAGTIQGDINVIPLEKGGRSIDATLSADKLALAALTGDSTETTSREAEQKPVQSNAAWSRDPIDLESLRGLTGQANVTIGELLYKKFVIHDFKTTAKFSDNTITLNELRGNLFDNGSFNVNGQLAPGAKGQAHRGSFAVSVKNADAKKLFEALGSKPFSEGVVNLEQKLAFNGTSAYALIQSLDGDGTLNVTKGVINGIDLDGLAAKLDRPNSLSDFAAIVDQARAGGQTAIGDLSVPITIRNGIGKVENVTVKTQKTALGLNGSVNLPEKMVDMTGQITFVEQRNLPPLIMHIQGPMAAPSKSFDTRNFTQFYAQKATEKLQQKVEDKLGKKLDKLLGVPEAPTAPAAPAPDVSAPEAPSAASPAAETPAPAPAPSAPAEKPKDALKQLGNQMLQNLLSGQH